MVWPSIKRVAADANVLLAAASGRAALRVFEQHPDIEVVTTVVTMGEVLVHLSEFGARYRLNSQDLQTAIDELPIVQYSRFEYASHLDEARTYIEYRDPSDIDLAALALKLDIPIWTNDNDFRELPVPVYTTAQLLRLLGM